MSLPRLPLGRAAIVASHLSREMRRAGLPFDEVTIVGSVRRFAPDVGRVALLVFAPRSRHRQILKALTRMETVTGVAGRTDTSVTVETERGTVTVSVTAPDQAGAALLWHTGSSAHVQELVRRANDRGLQFENGVLLRHGTLVTTLSETECYNLLGLPFIPPELREGADEFSAAAEGRLPQLVSDEHIRGDLHMHTSWSDGRDDIADMVMASKQLGYEYIAITDHSQRAMSSRKLAIDDVARQREALDEVRGRTHAIAVLHGVEVDIMPDGSLDFDDELLAGFDIVLASLHDHAGHDSQRLTERYLSAIRHPLVTVITHPANRSPGHSPGYDVDFDRLFAAAVEHRTALEIDGAPGHLDLDGAVSRRAAAAGVTLTIDSDAHRAEWLGRQMRFGVGTARRGWIERHQVLNTRGLSEVQAFIATKRR